jgi:hypothetical protein
MQGASLEELYRSSGPSEFFSKSIKKQSSPFLCLCRNDYEEVRGWKILAPLEA